MSPSNIHKSTPILVTSALLKRIVWGTHLHGPPKLILSRDLYLHDRRLCKGELLECGHIVVPNHGSHDRRSRRCPLCLRILRLAQESVIRSGEITIR